MDLGLTGKVAIIGGASKGLGRACAQTLAEEGARITICSRTQDDLERAAAEIRDTTGTEVLVFARRPGQRAEHQRPGFGHSRPLRAVGRDGEQLGRPAAGKIG